MKFGDPSNCNLSPSGYVQNMKTADHRNSTLSPSGYIQSMQIGHPSNSSSPVSTYIQTMKIFYPRNSTQPPPPNDTMEEGIFHYSPKTDASGDHVILSTIGILLAACIIAVNLVTLSTLQRTPSLRTLSNAYMASLAVSDLLVGLVLITLSLAFIPSFRARAFDRHMRLCHLMMGGCLGITIVSTLHMTLIAIDRYIYIVWPYLYLRLVTRRVVTCSISTVWALGVVFTAIPQAVGRMDVIGCGLQSLPVGYTSYSICVLFAFSATVNIILYSCILHTVWHQRRALDRSRCSSVRSASLTDPCKSTFDKVTASHLEESLKDSQTKSTAYGVLSPIQNDKKVTSKSLNILKLTKALTKRSTNADLLKFRSAKNDTKITKDYGLSAVNDNSIKEQMIIPRSLPNAATCKEFTIDFQYDGPNKVSKSNLETNSIATEKADSPTYETQPKRQKGLPSAKRDRMKNLRIQEENILFTRCKPANTHQSQQCNHVSKITEMYHATDVLMVDSTSTERTGTRSGILNKASTKDNDRNLCHVQTDFPSNALVNPVPHCNSLLTNADLHTKIVSTLSTITTTTTVFTTSDTMRHPKLLLRHQRALQMRQENWATRRSPEARGV